MTAKPPPFSRGPLFSDWNSQMKTQLLLVSLLTLLAPGLALAQDATPPPAPTVTTDQADYPPGSTVYITGTGFAPGETVTCQVLHVDATVTDNDTSTAHQPWDVVADDSGNFSTTWYVPLDEDELGATLQLTATGQTSGLTAQATFTDASLSTAVTFPISGTSYNTSTY